MRFQRREPHLLTGSYALDALAGTELKTFERHLVRCQFCTAEVRGLRAAAALLALEETTQPPAAMQGRVLARVSRTRQLPPLPAHDPHRAPLTISAWCSARMRASGEL